MKTKCCKCKNTIAINNFMVAILVNKESKPIMCAACREKIAKGITANGQSAKG